MLRVVNMGAFRSLPLYRTRSVFRSLGQGDFIDPMGDLPTQDFSVPSVPDLSTTDQLNQELINEESASSKITTSETTPSNLQPSSKTPSTPSSSSGGTDILSSVGKFFASLFTPSNISAAAAAAKAASAKNPGTVPIVSPAAPGALSIDTSTLLLIGGATIAGVVVISVLLRP